MAGVTNEEIAAVAEGSADRDTERRVTAAALLDPNLRERLNLLRAAETVSSFTVAEDDASFDLRAQSLKIRMAELASALSQNLAG